MSETAGERLQLAESRDKRCFQVGPNYQGDMTFQIWYGDIGADLRQYDPSRERFIIPRGGEAVTAAAMMGSLNKAEPYRYLLSSKFDAFVDQGRLSQEAPLSSVDCLKIATLGAISLGYFNDPKLDIPKRGQVALAPIMRLRQGGDSLGHYFSGGDFVMLGYRGNQVEQRVKLEPEETMLVLGAVCRQACEGSKSDISKLIGLRRNYL